MSDTPKDPVEISDNAQEESPKFQPWRSHWPPASIDTKGPSHGVPKGQLLIDRGDTVSAPEDRRTVALPNATEKDQAQ